MLILMANVTSHSGDSLWGVPSASSGGNCDFVAQVRRREGHRKMFLIYWKIMWLWPQFSITLATLPKGYAWRRARYVSRRSARSTAAPPAHRDLFKRHSLPTSASTCATTPLCEDPWIFENACSRFCSSIRRLITSKTTFSLVQLVTQTKNECLLQIKCTLKLLVVKCMYWFLRLKRAVNKSYYLKTFDIILSVTD